MCIQSKVRTELLCFEESTFLVCLREDVKLWGEEEDGRALVGDERPAPRRPPPCPRYTPTPQLGGVAVMLVMWW